mmetsp:Transcript_159134/g.280986  ORF Transcript_159134/g.280986 Transcript_159134/m.280986 type:complete len:204 (-) Transcript_159134:8-619(-)
MSAQLPLEDAGRGALVCTEVEGTKFWSKKSRLKFQINGQEWMEKSTAATNLYRHAGLNVKTIGECLCMSIEEVEHVLGLSPIGMQQTASDESAVSKRPSLPESSRDARSQTQSVHWEECMNFVVKDPTTLTMSVELNICGEGLFAGSRKKFVGSWSPGPSGLNFFKPHADRNIICRCHCDKERESVEVKLGVRLDPLTDNLLM